MQLEIETSIINLNDCFWYCDVLNIRYVTNVFKNKLMDNKIRSIVCIKCICHSLRFHRRL